MGPRERRDKPNITKNPTHHPRLRLLNRNFQPLSLTFTMYERRLRTDRAVGIHGSFWWRRGRGKAASTLWAAGVAEG